MRTWRLNCWIVAMWFWAQSRARDYAWIRRSHAFSGLIPHFGYGKATGWRQIKIIEYIPPKRRRWRRGGDWVLFFPGHYRVIQLRVMAIRKWETKEQATADYYFRGIDRREKSNDPL